MKANTPEPHHTGPETRFTKSLKPDAAQLEAICFRHGPCAVIAGPGSGKTAVITRRAARLIADGTDPGHILTITFTKAAAWEMQSRFLKLTNGRFQEAAFGTFHSLFYNVLANSAGDTRYRFIGPVEKKHLMEQVLKERGLRFSAEVTEALLRAVSKVKNTGSPEKKRRPVSSGVPFAERFPELFDAYEELRRSLNMIDYDDIAPECLALLRDNQELLIRWRMRFRHIQIDEFQDVNPVQYQLATLLAGTDRNLFVVGDDDQSIYGFRGATPDILQLFFRDFPDAQQIVLQTNYRTGAALIRASSRVIAGNKNRIAKNMVPSKNANNGTFLKTVYPERQLELEALPGTIREQTASGTPYEQVAVLYRTSSDALRLAHVLKQADIPFRMTEKIPVPFTEAAAEDVLSYLRFAVYGAKRSDFLRIMNKPVRYLSRECAASETVREQDVLAYYAASPSGQKKVRRFFLDCDRIAHLKTHLAIGYVLQAVGLERHFRKETDADGFVRAQEVLTRLHDLAKEYPDIRSFLTEIEALQEHVRESTRQETSVSLNKQGVRLMSMHASKGLEFDVVCLPLLNEGIMPQIRALTDGETEEERRLLYVAMTRARKRLYLSCAEKDGTKRLIPSRFLS